MDLEGIARAVVLAEYAPNVTGVIPSEFTAEFCSATDRLIPFGSVDLNSDVDAGTQAEHCIKELGCRGLKLLPPSQYFYPDDPRILPAYEVSQHLGVPVMFHTGTSLWPGTRIRYGDPLLLDDIANDFPELKIIMCHGGRPFWYQEAEWMLRRHQNICIDVSGIPPKQLPQAFPKMEKFPDRFLFGSDWPNVVSVGDQVRQIRELDLDPRTTEALLWENAARLLGLDGLAA
jgi:predicted TIM-barrel fold metal-dependent hydrolase